MDRLADFACSIMKRRSSAISFALAMGSEDTVTPMAGDGPSRDLLKIARQTAAGAD